MDQMSIRRIFNRYCLFSNPAIGAVQAYYQKSWTALCLQWTSAWVEGSALNDTVTGLRLENKGREPTARPSASSPCLNLIWLVAIFCMAGLNPQASDVPFPLRSLQHECWLTPLRKDPHPCLRMSAAWNWLCLRLSICIAPSTIAWNRAGTTTVELNLVWIFQLNLK